METLRLLGIVVFASLGVFFTFVSAVGVLRLPDVYARAHTASQVDTLGAGFALAAVALGLGWNQATVYTALLLFFVFITNPTAAHAIARSAAESGVEPMTADDVAVGTDANAQGSENGTDDRDPEDGSDVVVDGGSDAPVEDGSNGPTDGSHGGGE